MHNFRWE